MNTQEKIDNLLFYYTKIASGRVIITKGWKETDTPNVYHCETFGIARHIESIFKTKEEAENS